MDPSRTQNDKCCWFPFKKAYTRRRIKPGCHGDYVAPATTFYLQNSVPGGKPVEVELFEYDDAASQHMGATELVLEGHPMPTDDNSVVVDTQQPCQVPNKVLASINPNCMSQEFWVDEIVDGGAWSCIEESLRVKKQLGPIPHQELDEFANYPLPKVEVVHEPRRSRSLGSNSIIDKDKTALQRTFCVRTNGSLQRPKHNARRQPSFHGYEIPEEKKDEEYAQALTALDIPELRASRTTRAIAPPPPQRRSRSLSSNRSKKAILCGPQRYDHIARQQRDMGPPSFEPSFYVEVEATREQLNAVKDLSLLKDSETQRPLLNPNTPTRNRAQPPENLDVARQSSLVDGDSAFMGSEISEVFNGEYLGSPLKPLTAAPLVGALKQGTFESRSKKESQSNRGSDRGSISESSGGSSASSDSDSTSWASKSSFKPPHEIARQQSGNPSRTSIKARPVEVKTAGAETEVTRKSSDLSRKMSDSSYKKTMSEKISRRVRSNGKSRTSGSAPGIDQNASPPSFQRQPISALTTTSDEKYTVSFRNPESEPHALGRNYISEITTGTSQRSRAQDPASLRNPSNFRSLRSVDEDAVLFGVNEFEGDQSSAPGGQRGLKSTNVLSQIQAGAFDDVFYQQSWDRQGAVDNTLQNPEPFQQDRSFPVIDSPLSPARSNMTATTQGIIRSPRSPGSQRTEGFFDDVSGLGTEAFRQYQNDDEDSLFSDLGSVESSKWDASRASRTTGNVSNGAISRYEQARREKLFRGDMTVQTDAFSANRDGAFACMDKWLD